MLPYFRKTDRDIAFFEEYINPRLPARLSDMHLHITRPCDTVHVSQEQIDKDWAMQCGFRMDEKDLAVYMQTLWGDRTVSVNAFPMPIRGVDLESANRHLKNLLDRESGNGQLRIRTAEMAISPDMNPDACEEMLLRGNFLGYKPYPDLVSGEKGADIRIPDFLPDAFMKSLDRNRRAVTIHLPRAGRIASPDNIRELLELRQKFPDVRIIIAHYGRSYNTEVIEAAWREMGDDMKGFWFDCAAVVNPAMHRFMLEHLPQERIFYGSDMPLLLWHGRRTWENGTYRNHVREAFAWSAGLPDSEEEKESYTFFLYEQMKALLDSTYDIGCRTLAEKVLCTNAENFLREVGV